MDPQPIRMDGGDVACLSRIVDEVFAVPGVLVALLDREFRFVKVGDTYAQASRRPASALIGRNHFDLYPHDGNRRIFEQVVRTKTPVTIREKPFRHPDQPERGITYWDWGLRPVINDRGEVWGLIFTLVDVTDRVKARRLSEERALLLQELTHRVKNNLQVISNLISMSGVDGSDVLYSRVAAMARLYDALSVSPDITDIDFAEYLGSVTGELRRALAGENVEVKITGSLRLPFTTANTLGIIANELIVNALKHGFTDGRPGSIDIAVDGTEANGCRMVLRQMTPAPFSLEKIEGGSGLGIRLVRSLLNGLGGELRVRNEPGALVWEVVAARGGL